MSNIFLTYQICKNKKYIYSVYTGGKVHILRRNKHSDTVIYSKILLNIPEEYLIKLIKNFILIFTQKFHF